MHVRNVVPTGTGVIGLAFLGSLIPPQAIAQNPVAPVPVGSGSSPAQLIVRNWNEPGRLPYQKSIGERGHTDPGELNCGGNFCEYTFPSPSKPLVLKHVSGVVVTLGDRPGSLPYMDLLVIDSNGGPVARYFMKPVLQVPGSTTANSIYVVNEPILAYVNPGQRAKITVIVSGNIGGSDNRRNVTLSGYFIEP